MPAECMHEIVLLSITDQYKATINCMHAYAFLPLSHFWNMLCCVQVVDADTQKAMLAWYYKKQEEEKVR